MANYSYKFGNEISLDDEMKIVTEKLRTDKHSFPEELLCKFEMC